MQRSTQLDVRFEAEQYEIVDFIPIFMKWSRQVSPELSSALPSVAGPITIRFLIVQLLIAIIVGLAYQHFILGWAFTIIPTLLSMAFAFALQLGIRIFNNWRVRKYAIKRAGDIMVQVLPTGHRVSPHHKERIRRVSPWFVPVGQFQSLEPGMKGLLVAVLSPADPKLFFLRDTTV